MNSIATRTLLDYYKAETLLLPKMLSTVYPQHKWHLWKFAQLPSVYWHSLSNQREFFDHVECVLSFESKEAWYSTPESKVIQLGGQRFLSVYGGSLYTALRSVYPNYDWLPWRFLSPPSGMSLNN